MRTKARIGSGGRLVIPAAFRRALGLKAGDDLILSLHEGELRILPSRVALKRAQELVARNVPEGVSLVDDLIEERIREVAMEEQEMHGGDLDHWIEVIRKRRGLS